jgi:hypothetical protein
VISDSESNNGGDERQEENVDVGWEGCQISLCGKI